MGEWSALLKPEFLALLVSVVAICVNVYISYKNRQYDLIKEEYFKKQKIVEKIISKLLILENHREKLKTFFELSFHTSKNKNSLFIDSNDTFNRSEFEKEGEEIATFIDIYFTELGEDWNFCLIKMSDLYTLVFKLSKKVEMGQDIDWQQEGNMFNKISEQLDEKPKAIARKLKAELVNFKNKNL